APPLADPPYVRDREALHPSRSVPIVPSVAVGTNATQCSSFAGSSWRNLLRCSCQTAGQEWVVWPRVPGPAGMRTYLPRLTRGISFSLRPGPGGVATSSAELVAGTGAGVFSRAGGGGEYREPPKGRT